MTNEDWIKGHFSAIAECAGNLRRNYDPERAVENDEAVQFLQRQLGAIEKLLHEPEPESLAASVLRLTDLCNRLELDVALASNAWLRERLTFKDQSLRACRAAEELLKERNDKLEESLKGLQRTLEEMGLS